MKRLSLLAVALVIFLWSPLLLTMAKGWTPQGFSRLFANPDILSALYQSLILAAISAVGATFMGTLTAFALPKLPRRSVHTVESALFLPLVLPEISLGLALLVWFVKIGLPFGWSTLIVGHVGFCYTYATLVMKANIESLDDNLIDAAQDLGANKWNILRHAILPQILPGIMASIATCFSLSLDDFLISFFIKGMDQLTLPIKIFSMLRLSFGPEVYTLSLFLCGFSILGVLLSQLWLRRSNKKQSLSF